MCELLLYIYTLCISLSYIPYSEQASNYTVVPVSVCAIAPPSLRANSPRDSEKKPDQASHRKHALAPSSDNPYLG